MLELQEPISGHLKGISVQLTGLKNHHNLGFNQNTTLFCIHEALKSAEYNYLPRPLRFLSERLTRRRKELVQLRCLPSGPAIHWAQGSSHTLPSGCTDCSRLQLLIQAPGWISILSATGLRAPHLPHAAHPQSASHT